MRETVFFQIEFVLLVISSILLPSGIYGYLMLGRSFSRLTVFALGLVLLLLSGVDLYLLQSMATQVRSNASLLDGSFFASEISIALYLLPMAFAGIGVNLMSHILIDHIKEAEQRHDRQRAMMHVAPPSARTLPASQVATTP